MRLRTSLIISLQNIISRNNGVKLKVNVVKALKTDRVAPYLHDNEDLALAGRVSKESIDFFTRQVRAIESVVQDKVELRESYQGLQSIPGVGRILALTIMLETGPIHAEASHASPYREALILMGDWCSNKTDSEPE